VRQRPFILIDLDSQAEFLPVEIRTWTLDRFLAWLRPFGAVDQAIRHGDVRPSGWLFRHASGRWTAFAFTADGRFYILGPRFRQVWGSPVSFDSFDSSSALPSQAAPRV
jgi:hypothetical protein